MEKEYMAGALMKLGRAKEALPMLETEMPSFRKAYGSGADFAEPLYFLTKAYVETGKFEQAEKSAEELVAVQEGKVAPTDRRFGASHLLWAEALVGEHRDRDALPHALIADKLLAANAISVGAKLLGAEAREVLSGIQSRLAR